MSNHPRQKQALYLLSLGYRYTEVSEETGMKYSGVAALARRNNIQTGLNVKHYDIDFTTSESKYWLGMLHADGHVSTAKTSKRTSFRNELILSLKDGEHIEKYQKWLNRLDLKISVTKITKRSPNPQYRFAVSSASLIKNLEQFGVTPTKSKDTYIPDILVYDSDFWRGFIDGDGCLQINPTKLSIICNTNVAEYYKLYCAKKGFFYREYVDRRNGLINVAHHGKYAINPLKEIYGNNPCVSLDRKQAIANQLLESILF